MVVFKKDIKIILDIHNAKSYLCNAMAFLNSDTENQNCPKGKSGCSLLNVIAQITGGAFIFYRHF
jgi:hypothetical protein